MFSAPPRRRTIAKKYSFLFTSPTFFSAKKVAKKLESGIADFKHKGLLLEITFTDGSTYEYFGVNANVYKKLINSDKQVRFAKRFIYDSYLYRKSKKATEGEE